MSSLPVKLVPDVWLASVMQRPAHRVNIDPSGTDLRQAIDAGSGFYYGRVPAADVAALRTMTDAGFSVVDVTITLECRGAAADKLRDVRAATPSDRDRVVEIARTGFQFSRFHLDPAVGTELANEVKAQWAGNFFSGQRGDAMIIAETEDGVVGFAQLLDANDGATVIDLIAVAPEARGRGLGSAMCRLAASRARVVRVGTQAANVGSLQFYERNGFWTVASSYVVHRHV